MALLRTTILLCALLLTLPAGVLHAQNTDPASRAATRLIIEGQEVIIHTVEKGETLYAISKKYSVSQADIAAFNPDIYYGVKKGQKLRIPVPQRQNTVLDGRTGQEYSLHVVLPGETLYQLARRFSTSVEAIREANLLQSDTLKLYETIRIPSLQDGADGEKPILHTVKRGEALYGIARLYDVSVDEITRQNPSIKERGLHEGDVLRIERLPTASNPSLENGLLESIPLQLHTALCDSAKPFPAHDTLRIALMLPFALGKRTKAVEDDVMESTNSDINVGADTRFLDYYQGTLLALEQFQQQGYNIRLSVFDTQRNTNRMRQIVASDSLSDAHLIIGPVYPENVTIASSYAALRRIAMVSPLSGKTPSFETNPFLYQANPSLLTQIRQVVRSLPYDSVGRIVLLREEGEQEKELSESVQFMLQEVIAERSIPPSLVQTVTFARGNTAAQSRTALQKHIMAQRHNIVLVPSNHEAFIGEVLGILNAIAVSSSAEVSVYGMPKWLRLPKLDIDELIGLHVTLFSPFHVDYNQEAVQSFVDTYRATFRCEPSQYAFQGYDLARYFVAALSNYGEDFRYCLHRQNVSLLQTPLHFEQSSEFGSYESTGLYLLRFTEQDGIVATPVPHTYQRAK